MTSPGSKWYEEGVPFFCKKCGNCCNISGYVWLSKQDIEKLSSFLKIDPDKFRHLHTLFTYGRISLKEKKDGSCIFLTDNRCSVYEARPIQCITYPWWPHLMKSLSSFQSGTEHCPGASIDSTKASLEVIEANLKLYQENFS